MRQDYSYRYSAGASYKQRSAGRRSPGGERWLKLVGIVVVAAMIAGIAVSVWFGWAVRTSLDQLSREQKVRQELSQVHGRLLEERDKLLSRERIEAAAARLGLYPPSRRQIRRP